jgi:hypothetical protein
MPSQALTYNGISGLWHCAANCCSHPRRVGPVAQWLELTAHNRLVGGSSPSGPTIVVIYQLLSAYLFLGLAKSQVANLCITF